MNDYPQEDRAQMISCPNCGIWHTSMTCLGNFGIIVAENAHLKEQIKTLERQRDGYRYDYEALGEEGYDAIVEHVEKLNGLLEENLRLLDKPNPRDLREARDLARKYYTKIKTLEGKVQRRVNHEQCYKFANDNEDLREELKQAKECIIELEEELAELYEDSYGKKNTPQDDK